MYYLYGKNIQNLRWEFIGEFETEEEVQNQMDWDADNYVSFLVSLKELEI